MSRRFHGALPPYSPRAAFFVVRAPALAVRLVFAAPAFHASFAAFGPPVKKALVERPSASSAPRTRAVALRFRRPILHHPLQALEPLLMCAVERAAEIPAQPPRERPALRLGAAEPLPHHLGRRGDLVLVGDE